MLKTDMKYNYYRRCLTESSTVIISLLTKCSSEYYSVE